MKKLLALLILISAIYAVKKYRKALSFDGLELFT